MANKKIPEIANVKVAIIIDSNGNYYGRADSNLKFNEVRDDVLESLISEDGAGDSIQTYILELNLPVPKTITIEPELNLKPVPDKIKVPVKIKSEEGDLSPVK